MDTRPEGTLRTDAALIGLTYTFDVLRLVPYASLAGRARSSCGARSTTPQSLLAMELGLGADYFVTRRVLAGLSFHYLFEPADLLSDPLNLGTNPFSPSIGDRARTLTSLFDRDARRPEPPPLLLGVRAEHQAHRRPLEAVGLAHLVDQEAAVGVADVGGVVGADEEASAGRTLACVA